MKLVRKWLIYVVGTDDGLLRGWFFTGGEWPNTQQKRVSVRTEREIGSGSESQPEFWALRYETPCKEVVPIRYWRTDLGITHSNGNFQVNIATYHSLIPGFIGKQPAAPIPTAPGVVREILNSKRWLCAAGSEHLLFRPKVLGPTDGEFLRDRLTASDRLCPIVLVCRNPSEDKLCVSADILAKNLVGTAVVYASDSESAETQWDKFLPYPFRCKSGMVRIYLPDLDFGNETNPRRHRFFTREQIHELGDEEVRAQIIRGIARRPGIDSRSSVMSLEDVQTRRREARLQSLRAQVRADHSTDELVSLLETDNKQLGKDNETLRQNIKSLQDQLVEVQQEAEDSEKEIATQNYRLQAQQQELKATNDQLRGLRETVKTVSCLSELPSTVHDVAETIQRLHPTKIIFTENALNSTRDRNDSLANTSWKLLWSMATTLHDLIFSNGGKPGDLEKNFKDKTGFDLAMTEGKQTKKDKKFMDARQIEYEGQTIDITPHVKHGKEPRLLRVHFFIDKPRSRLIIGHCGSHLETYGTHRR